MATHSTQIVPRFGELDPYNHVNHAVYVSYFEAARCVALEDVGMALPDLSDENVQIVVTNLEVRFREPATARDTLRIETEVAELRRASTKWNQRIIREADDTVLVQAQLTAAVCDNAGKPRRPPPDFMSRLEALIPDETTGESPPQY
ncbi:acyl-CoA thioesterase [Candidatus Poriferisodalis sp.]|uniref:acyl-CoA thioesterase n=1 Tax=Candidatus Poriferisodalis sp. TaxID=3101277 RepID=UPI003B012D1D